MVILLLSLICLVLTPHTVKAYPTDLNRSQNIGIESYNATVLISRVIEALGGASALADINHGLTYSAPNIYRSQTLTQNYNLEHSDQSVASSGSQNISFSFASGNLQQRVDRYYTYSEYWIWAFPDLNPPIDFSLVVQDGSERFACFVKGQNSFFSADPTVAGGYTDAFLRDYLISLAQKFDLLGLLKRLEQAEGDINVTTAVDPISNLNFPALEDSSTGLTLIINSTTYLPYLVRSYESHAIFGNSSNDLILSEFRPVPSTPGTTVILPHKFQTMYNSAEILENFIVESITLNPVFPDDFFSGLPNNQSRSPEAQPQESSTYGRAEVGEMFAAGLWRGTFDYNISDVVINHPIPDLNQLSSVHIGYPDYVQLVVELEDGVLVTDAPSHRSAILIQWIAETIGKPIKYIVPSHHHHDHAYGIGDYVNAGATIVVPEVAAHFYSKVGDGGAHVVTYNEASPFAIGDDKVQFRSVWKPEAPHAKDWSYSVVAPKCPSEESKVVVFCADVWSPGSDGLRFDIGYARHWLDWAVEDGLPKDAIIVGSHGSTANGTTDILGTLIDITGFAYPGLSPKDWKAGGPFC